MIFIFPFVFFFSVVTSFIPQMFLRIHKVTAVVLGTRYDKKYFRSRAGEVGYCNQAVTVPCDKC